MAPRKVTHVRDFARKVMNTEEIRIDTEAQQGVMS